MTPVTLFIFFMLLIGVALFAVWRYWLSLARVSPEEEAYDEQMAALNERQANRLSDERLTKSMTDDEAWQIMVQRGKRVNTRRRKPPRPTRPRLLPPPEQPARRERYGGEFSRRVDERRDRAGDVGTERPRRSRADD